MIIKFNTTNMRFYTEEKDPENNFFNRLPRIKKYLKNANADLYGFQELTVEMDKDIVKAIGSRYGHYIHGRTTKFDEGIGVFYKKSKFNLIKRGIIYLNEHPDKPGKSWGTGCPRVCVYLILEIKNTSQQLIFASTHLDHVSELARQESIKLINNYFKTFNLPTIINGDFNVYENSPTYNFACEKFIDVKYAAKQVHGGSSYHGFGEKPFDPNGSPIDYCFITKEFKSESYYIENYLIDGKQYSDHYGITCKVSL